MEIDTPNPWPQKGWNKNFSLLHPPAGGACVPAGRSPAFSGLGRGSVRSSAPCSSSSTEHTALSTQHPERDAPHFPGSVLSGPGSLAEVRKPVTS